MPTRRARLSKAEQAEYRTMSSRLEEMSLMTGGAEIHEPKIQRLSVEPIHEDFARVHDLSNGAVGAVAVSLPAKLVILGSGVMITDATLFPQWDDCSLDLEEPQEHQYFEEFTQDFPTYRPKILNKYLVDCPRPLQICQLQGLIIATGWSRVPAEYPDEKRVSFHLCLRDEQEREYDYYFYARVDRRLKIQQERKMREAAELVRNRVPLFDPRERAERGTRPDTPSVTMSEKIPGAHKCRDTIH